MRKIFIAMFAVVVLFFANQVLASTYLANTKSGKFHYSNCRTIKHPNAAHFVAYESRDACVNAGYKPCGVCHP